MSRHHSKTPNVWVTVVLAFMAGTHFAREEWVWFWAEAVVVIVATAVTAEDVREMEAKR